MKQRLNALWKLDNSDTRKDNLGAYRIRDDRLRNPAVVVCNKPQRVVSAKRLGTLL